MLRAILNRLIRFAGLERTCIDVRENGQFFKCSECGAIDIDGGIGNYTWNYCPQCGARIVK